MDALEKIDKLRKDKNWSVYKLAEESGISQSTIANMFSRQTQPSFSTLQEICKAFGITLSEFLDENNNMSDKELILIGNYRKLSKRDKEIIENLMSILINNKQKSET